MKQNDKSFYKIEINWFVCEKTKEKRVKTNELSGNKKISQFIKIH